MDQNNNTININNRFRLPSPILINDKKYTIKDALANNLFSYRCENRKCKFIIHVKKNNLLNYIKSTLFHLPIKLSKHSHLEECDIKLNSDLVKNNAVNVELLSNDHILKKIIEINIFKPFYFHKSNLQKYNINLTDNQLKYNLEIIKNNNYVKNEIYNNNIFNYRVNLTDNIKNIEVLFCMSKIEYFNFKKNLVEKAIIYSTNFQLNLLSNSKTIYLDGTFKVAPKNFLQLVTIHGESLLTKTNIPLVFILMTSKTKLVYKKIFLELNNLLNSLDLKIYFNYLYTDF